MNSLLINISTCGLYYSDLLDAAEVTDSSLYFRSEVWLDPKFRSHPIALPKPQPLIVLGVDLMVASSHPELALTLGASCGVRPM